MSLDPTIIKELEQGGLRVIMAFMKDERQIVVVERKPRGKQLGDQPKPCKTCGGK